MSCSVNPTAARPSIFWLRLSLTGRGAAPVTSQAPDGSANTFKLYPIIVFYISKLARITSEQSITSPLPVFHTVLPAPSFLLPHRFIKCCVSDSLPQKTFRPSKTSAAFHLHYSSFHILNRRRYPQCSCMFVSNEFRKEFGKHNYNTSDIHLCTTCVSLIIMQNKHYAWLMKICKHCISSYSIILWIHMHIHIRIPIYVYVYRYTYMYM